MMKSYGARVESIDASPHRLSNAPLLLNSLLPRYTVLVATLVTHPIQPCPGGAGRHIAAVTACR